MPANGGQVSKGDMSISAFSRRSMLSVKALRLYDDIGLLRPERKDPLSRYRYYSETQLETARLISLLRKLDVPLAEIEKIVQQAPEDASERLSTWWNGEMARMAGRADLLQFIRDSVLGEVHVNEPSNERYEVSVRKMPAQTYLYVSRHVHGPELPSFISESTEYLLQRAGEYGGSCGDVAVMFYGQVDLDSDGPVDVCLPVATQSKAEDPDVIRTESPHLQAYTTLQEHQLVFPQILQVYQWMRRWIQTHDYEISGLPRELYLADFAAAKSNDAVCEIAYPIRKTQGTPS